MGQGGTDQVALGRAELQKSHNFTLSLVGGVLVVWIKLVKISPALAADSLSWADHT